MFVVESYAAVRRFVLIEGRSRREAARIFGLSRETVAKMCRFSFPPGYTRTVPAVKPKLGRCCMAVQRWIVREILRDLHVHVISHAYAKGSSILICAIQHAGAAWLLKLDIHDFFESIPERKVYRVFREIGYQPLVSFELARLCSRPWINPPKESVKRRSVANPQRRGPAFYARVYTGYLQQGAPTSPTLSNLVCRQLDRELAALAKRTGLVVTRYSDDITFSGSASGFDRELAMSLVEDVRTALSKHGFRLHERKISVVPPGARKVVLGLLVDRDRPRLSRDFRQKVADHVRGIEKFGLAWHAATRRFVAMTGMANIGHAGS